MYLSNRSVLFWISLSVCEDVCRQTNDKNKKKRILLMQLSFVQDMDLMKIKTPPF